MNLIFVCKQQTDLLLRCCKLLCYNNSAQAADTHLHSRHPAR